MYLYFGIKIFGTVNEASPRETCRNGVALYAHANDMGGPSSPNFNCPTQFVYITDKGILKNDQSIDSEVTEASVKRAIANEMYDCWYKFLGGTKEVFERSFKGPTGQCIVCSEISIEDSVEIGTANLELRKYLQDTKIQQYSSDSGQSTTTYYDYLGRTTPKVEIYDMLRAETGFYNSVAMGGVEASEKLLQSTPVPGEYAVVFSSVTPRKGSPDTDYYATVYFVNKGNIQDLKCDQLY
jgi:hypothetical protein